jgi:hypothetical protein
MVTKDTLFEWALARLRDAASEGAIEPETPEDVLQRQAKRLELELHQAACGFIDCEF